MVHVIFFGHHVRPTQVWTNTGVITTPSDPTKANLNRVITTQLKINRYVFFSVVFTNFFDVVIRPRTSELNNKRNRQPL